MNKDLSYPKALSLIVWLGIVCKQRKRLPKCQKMRIYGKLLFYAKHFLPCDAYFLVELLQQEGVCISANYCRKNFAQNAKNTINPIMNGIVFIIFALQIDLPL